MTDDSRGSMSAETETDIQRLLELAGPRIKPPEAVEARIRAAALAAVDALPTKRRSLNVQPGWALAASILLLVGLGFLLDPFGAEETPVANVLYATGGYTIRGSDSGSTALQSGSIVQTSQGGRLLVGLGAERMVRLDHGASLTLHSASEIWLHSGRIYVDADGGEPIRVVTPFASVTDVGTLFQVAVSGESLIVATREGRVDVQLGDRRVQSEASAGVGEELLIEGLALMSRTPVPTMDERWSWTQQSRPPFAVRGRSVHEYLEWAARESGRVLRYQTRLAGQQSALKQLAVMGEPAVGAEDVSKLLGTMKSFVELDSAPHELLVGLRQEP